MKHTLNYAEIYITNVCNYSCTHCQSLNNFAFKGHQLWEDYRDEYESLSNRVDITTVQIIGGEPTLNPDFEKWVDGISNLWPNAKLQIATNGSQLDKLNDSIYKILSRNSGTLWLTCHDITLYDSMLDFAKEFLEDIVSDFQPDKDAHDNWKITYDTIRDTTWPDCDRIDQFAELPDDIKKEFNRIHRLNTGLHLRTVPRMLIDKNGVEVRLDWSQTFVSSAIKVIDDQRLTMKYNSDPIHAHENCYYKKCHQINKGKIYKCPLVSVLPDFVNQFNVDVDDSYVPITAQDDDTTILNFINNLDQPIPQCKLCPSNYTRHNFVGTDKKIKIKVI
jgi:MoaA/NifB/PqqE/SkfB family radical SAM enzyme